jgi:hypothetical protein
MPEVLDGKIILKWTTTKYVVKYRLDLSGSE